MVAVESTKRRRPHDNDAIRDGMCPKCGVETARSGWWCADCLKVKVFEARAALSVCHCVDGKEPHRHTVDGGVA